MFPALSQRLLAGGIFLVQTTNGLFRAFFFSHAFCPFHLETFLVSAEFLFVAGDFPRVVDKQHSAINFNSFFCSSDPWVPDIYPPAFQSHSLTCYSQRHRVPCSADGDGLFTVGRHRRSPVWTGHRNHRWVRQSFVKRDSIRQGCQNVWK